MGSAKHEQFMAMSELLAAWRAGYARAVRGVRERCSDGGARMTALPPPKAPAWWQDVWTPYADKHYAKLTPCQRVAVQWARTSYGVRWRQRLKGRPEELPIGFRHCYWHPFGREDWNDYMRVLRRLYWQGRL
jgi:hypothetical protein